VRVKKPSVGALLLGLVPFVAMCFSVSLWDRIDPMIFGIPFNFFWLIAWIVLSTLCMGAAYRAEAARSDDKKDIGAQ
jgi:membrane protein required for beta-lactamase induction